MHKSFSVFFLILLNSILISSYGQSGTPEGRYDENIIPPSPTQAALIKYIEIPVNAYTGLPEISIPLYEFQSKGYSLPIKLSYHASGVKITDIPSWVGTGWSLMAGGSITRVIRGSADDMSFAIASPLRDTEGYLTNGKYHLYPSTATPQLTPEDIEWRQAMGYFDTEPDLFYYSFGNYSGKFVFTIKPDFTPEVVTLNDDKLKVTFERGDGQFSSFTVTTPDGFRYKFGAVEKSLTAIDIADTDNRQGNYLYDQRRVATAWQLTEVYSPQDFLIAIFTYSTVEEIFETVNSISTYYPDGTYCDLIRSVRTIGKNIKTTASTRKLTTIQVTGQGKVEFVLSNNNREDLMNSGKALEKIFIINTKGDTIKAYRLQQSYVSDNSGTEYFNKRLFLDQLIETGEGGEELPPYQFSYYNRSQLPSRRSLSTDFWGYYNGAANTSLIPPIPELNLAGANRNADTFAVYGVLSQIRYPTSGTTNMQFELNDYSYIGRDTFPWIIDQKINQNLSATLYAINGTSNPSFGFAVEDQYANVSFGMANNSSYPANITPWIEPVILKPGVITPTSINDILPDNSRPAITVTQSGSKQFLKGWYMARMHIVANASNPTNTSGYLSFSLYNATFKAAPPRKGGGIRIKTVYHETYPGDSKPKRTSYSYVDKNMLGNSSGSLVTGNFMHVLKAKRLYSKLVNTGPINHPIQIMYLTCTAWEVKTDNNVQFELTSGANIGYKYVSVIETGNGRKDLEFVSPREYPDLISYTFPFQSPTSFEGHRGGLIKEIILNESGDTVQTTGNTYNYYVVRNLGIPKTAFEIYDPRNVDVLTYADYVGIVAGSWNYPLWTHVGGSENIIKTAFYQLNVVRPQLTASTITQYSGSNKMKTIRQISYNLKNHQIFEEAVTLSNGLTKVIRNQYPVDCITTDARITSLLNKNILNVPIDIKTIVDNKLMSHQQMSYSSSGKITDLYSEDQQLNVTPPAFNTSQPYNLTTKEATLRYNQYDNLSVLDDVKNPRKAYIFDYNQNYPIAECIGGDSSTIAYTSFEADGTGNWILPDAIRNTSTALTGKQSYLLTSGNTIQRQNLPTGKIYIVTYWSKGTPLTVNSSSAIALTTKNGWTQYRHELPNTTAAVSITGNNIILDELRLYPLGSHMNTYTYDLLLGMTSQIGNKGQISFYYYDKFKRLSLIRDIDMNVLKQIKYKYSEPIGTP